MADSVSVHEGLFTTSADGTARLVGGRCRSCGRHHFPRADTCPYCSGQDVEEVFLSPDASLWAWTPPSQTPASLGVASRPPSAALRTRAWPPAIGCWTRWA